MANFKRKGPKSTRAGCLMCKRHKLQGQKLKEKLHFSDIRRRVALKDREEVVEAVERPSCSQSAE